MSDFSYTPDKNFSQNTAPRLIETKFGDGYSQRLNLSMNQFNKSWSLVFNNRSSTDVLAMETFFEARGGGTSFTWTPTDGSEETVICQTWNITWVAPSVRSLSATFIRVFE